MRRMKAHESREPVYTCDFSRTFVHLRFFAKNIYFDSTPFFTKQTQKPRKFSVAPNGIFHAAKIARAQIQVKYLRCKRGLRDVEKRVCSTWADVPRCLFITQRIQNIQRDICLVWKLKPVTNAHQLPHRQQWRNLSIVTGVKRKKKTLTPNFRRVSTERVFLVIRKWILM